MKKEIQSVKLVDLNSNLYISGCLNSSSSKIKVFVDDKLLFESNPNLSDNKYSFSNLDIGNAKVISIYKGSLDNNVLLLKIKTSTLKRRQSYSKKINYLKRNIGFLWSEYHFLVPPKKLKEYVKLFYNRIFLNKSKDDKYYQIFSLEDYNNWLVENKTDVLISELSYNPLISIIMPVYNVDKVYLSEAINSVLNQTYKNFELCIADDASTNQETLEYLKYIQNKYDNIKIIFKKKNSHISEASNTALDIAKGDFIGLMDNDDVLDKNALFEVVKCLNENKKLDLIYTDEDKISKDGFRCDPHFKPDYSPDTLLSHNYICHFSVIRTALIKKIGGFRKGYEGAQDYDLMLRITEKTNNIYHIPKILYHWRMIEGSTSMTTDNKSYASIAGMNALKDALKRRNIKADISNIYTSYILNYKVNNNPKVSIIIPTKDKIDLLLTCVNSIYEKTNYSNFEVIIVDNNSIEKRTLVEFENLKNKYKTLKVYVDKGDFNFSRINNLGVTNSTGDYLLFLNNDTKIVSSDWLEIMLGYASQKHIGAVGPKLLFSNDKIQHAGVVVGVGDEKIANHAYYLKDKFAPALAGRLIVPYNYSALTGACLMVSKEKFLEVGGLTEDLPINYNDIDFCLKLLEKGYYNVFLPQIEVYHYESLSRGKKLDSKREQELYNSSKYMKKRWKKILNNDPFYNENLSKEMCFVLDKVGEK